MIKNKHDCARETRLERRGELRVSVEGRNGLDLRYETSPCGWGRERGSLHASQPGRSGRAEGGQRNQLNSASKQ